VEASSARAVSDSWTIKLLAAMLLSLTIQALLKEKNKACVKGLHVPPSKSQVSAGFFLFFLRAKVRVPFAWFLQIPPPPTDTGSIRSEMATECPAQRAVLPAAPCRCGVEIRCPTWEDGL